MGKREEIAEKAELNLLAEIESIVWREGLHTDPVKIILAALDEYALIYMEERLREEASKAYADHADECQESFAWLADRVRLEQEE